MKPLDKIIVALDQMSLQEIDVFLNNPVNQIPTVKIGLELFLKYGPELVEKISKKYNKKIFLDLKLHDIPNTVEKAVTSLQGLPIHFLTVHLSGGEAMLKASLKAAQKNLPECKILGVSFLTSLESNDLDTIFGIKDSKAAFIKLFTLAKTSGVHGVISSPHEVALLKKHFPELLSVTPGIRFSDEIKSDQVQDQKRVMAPEEAFLAGSDYLVIGRSLTQASNLSERLKLFQN